jgi:hypothetical protein
MYIQLSEYVNPIAHVSYLCHFVGLSQRPQQRL